MTQKTPRNEKKGIVTNILEKIGIQKDTGSESKDNQSSHLEEPLPQPGYQHPKTRPIKKRQRAENFDPYHRDERPDGTLAKIKEGIKALYSNSTIPNFSRDAGSTGNPEEVISYRGLFTSYITDDDREYMSERDELMFKAFDKIAGTLTNNWLHLELDDPDEEGEKFIKFLMNVMEEINLKGETKRSIVDALKFGEGYTGVIMDDRTMAKSPSRGATDILYVRSLYSKWVKVKQFDTRVKSKKFNQPRLYTYKTGANILNAQRVLRIILYPIKDGNEGRSLVDPNFDKAVSKKLHDYSFDQTVNRYANPPAEIIHPNDPQARQDAENNFGKYGVTGLRAWLHPRLQPEDEWEMKLHGAEGVALAPKEYYDIVIDPYLAGLICPRTLIMGSTGSAQGNDTNLRNFYSDMSAMQNTRLTPYFWDFFNLLKDSGYFKANGWSDKKIPKFKPVWNPLYVLTAKEEAQNKLMKAKEDQILSFRKGIGAKTTEEIRIERNLAPMNDKQIEAEQELLEVAPYKPAVNPTDEGEEPDVDQDDPNDGEDKEISDKVPFSTTGNKEEEELEEALIEGDDEKILKLLQNDETLEDEV